MKTEKQTLSVFIKQQEKQYQEVSDFARQIDLANRSDTALEEYLVYCEHCSLSESLPTEWYIMQHFYVVNELSYRGLL